jgi:hypothetical protein
VDCTLRRGGRIRFYPLLEREVSWWNDKGWQRRLTVSINCSIDPCGDGEEMRPACEVGEVEV